MLKNYRRLLTRFFGEAVYTYGLKLSTKTNTIEIQIAETHVLFFNKYSTTFSCLNVQKYKGYSYEGAQKYHGL